MNTIRILPGRRIGVGLFERALPAPLRATAPGRYVAVPSARGRFVVEYTGRCICGSPTCSGFPGRAAFVIRAGRRYRLGSRGTMCREGIRASGVPIGQRFNLKRVGQRARP